MSEKFTSHNNLNDGLLARFLLANELGSQNLENSYSYAEAFSAEYKDLLGASLKGPATISTVPLYDDQVAELAFDASYKGVYIWQIDNYRERYDLIVSSDNDVFATRYRLSEQGAVQRRDPVHDKSSLSLLQGVVENSIELPAFTERVHALREEIANLRQEYGVAMAKRVLQNPDWERTALFRKSDDADDAAARLMHAGFAAGSRSKRTLRPLLYAVDWRPALQYKQPWIEQVEMKEESEG